MNRRFFIFAALVAVVAMGGLVTSTASADKPTVLVQDFVPEGPDGGPLAFESPCTGELVTVSLFTRTVKVHDHNGRLVGSGTQTAVSDQGHVLTGQTRIQVNPNVLSAVFSDNWEHPTTGEKFRVHGVRQIDLTGETPIIRVLKFDVTCQGKPA